jgi:translation initiation factor 1A
MYKKNVLVTVCINDTVTFVEDGFDEDIEFCDEVSDEG